MRTADVTMSTVDAVTDGRSILPEDAEGWLRGPGAGAGPGAVKENMDRSVVVWTEYPPPVQTAQLCEQRRPSQRPTVRCLLLMHAALNQAEFLEVSSGHTGLGFVFFSDFTGFLNLYRQPRQLFLAQVHQNFLAMFSSHVL